MHTKANNNMPVPKKVSQEECSTITKGELVSLRATAKALIDLADSIGRSQDFQFTVLEDAKKALQTIDSTKGSLRMITKTLALRGKTRVAETCKLVDKA